MMVLFTYICFSGKHYLLLSRISEAAALHRELAEQLFMAPVVSFADLSEKPEKYKAKYTLEVSVEVWKLRETYKQTERWVNKYADSFSRDR